MKLNQLAAVAGVSAVFLAGCSTTNTAYVDPNSNKTLVTMNQMGVQDWNKLTDDVLQKLMNEAVNAGSLTAASGPGGKSIMALSRISNNTGKQIDTAEMTKRIQIALMQSGKVLTDVTASLGGPEDPLAAAEKRRQALISGQAITRPDYTLSGKVLEKIERAGNTTQVTYIVQLTLANNQGLGIWEGEARVIKQGQRGAAGW